MDRVDFTSTQHKWWHFLNQIVPSRYFNVNRVAQTLKLYGQFFSNEELLYLANFFSWETEYEIEKTVFYLHMQKRKQDLLKMWLE